MVRRDGGKGQQAATRCPTKPSTIASIAFYLSVMFVTASPLYALQAETPLASVTAANTHPVSMKIGGTVVLASELPLASTAAVPSIDGRDIGCRAAANWGLAEVLRARGRTLTQLYCDQDDCARVAAQALSKFLQLQAANQEDIAAATGMRAYYTRVALAEQLSLSAHALELVDAEDEKQQALMEGGLAAGADLSEFVRRRIEIADQRLQVESQDHQLRSVLFGLTKLNYLCEDIHHERLEVQRQNLNCSSLRQTALSLRHDLCGWRVLARAVNENSAPEFGKMIPTLVGGWTLPMPTIGPLKQLLCAPDTTGLAANMKRELELVVSNQTEWICQTVEQKCNQLELSYRRIELAQQTIDSWLTRLEQLEQLQVSGAGKPELVALAQVELLKARSAEVSRRLDARLAEIDLAEATGGLAQRCCKGEAWLLTGASQVGKE